MRQFSVLYVRLMCPSLRFRNADGARCALRCDFATHVFYVFLEKLLLPAKIVFDSMQGPGRSVTYLDFIDFHDGQYSWA